jgi:signal transduction histidine kinase
VSSAPDILKNQDAADPVSLGIDKGPVTIANRGVRRWGSEWLARSGFGKTWMNTEFWSDRVLARYALALLLLIAATGASFGLQVFTDRALSFPFYVAVVLSTWFGVGPGLLVIVCSALVVDFFWIPPLYTIGIDDGNWAWYIIFTGSALISLVWTWQRRQAERALESTVAERTAELVSANTALTREIAERQAAEAELQETQAEVARTLRLATVAETAAAIAHEINQPLAAISANASACQRSLARDPPILDLARDAAGCIVADANRAAEVVGRVRALLNKEGPRHVPVDINHVIQDVLALSRGAADRQAIAIQTDLTEPLPPVLGDIVQLQQVLLNLVTNAFEAMATVAGWTRILTIRSAPEQGDAVTVTVEDSGGGIDTKHAERVFDSFYTTKPNGIGVGLSISRSIIEAHGGRLWLVSDSPVGARFCFALPAVPPPTNADLSGPKNAS